MSYYRVNVQAIQERDRRIRRLVLIGVVAMWGLMAGAFWLGMVVAGYLAKRG